MRLFRPDPRGRFRIRFKVTHTWPDGVTSPDIIAFECPPGKELGYTQFSSNSVLMKMNFFQGKTRAKGGPSKWFHRKDYIKRRIDRANQLLGKPWFEVFMDRIVEAYRPADRAGVRFSGGLGFNGLAMKIQARYFKRRSDSGSRFGNFDLSRQKRRVRRLLHLR